MDWGIKGRTIDDYILFGFSKEICKYDMYCKYNDDKENHFVMDKE